MAMLASGSYSLGSINPWSSNDTLLGIRLGDPQSGLVEARRQGLLPHHVLESSHHQEQVPGVWFLLPESKRRVRELFWSHEYSLAWRTLVAYETQIVCLYGEVCKKFVSLSL